MKRVCILTGKSSSGVCAERPAGCRTAAGLVTIGLGWCGHDGGSIKSAWIKIRKGSRSKM